MTEQRASSGSTFLSAVGSVLGFLLRLLFVLVIGILIGLGLFYGIPWVYERLVWPVQENAARVAILEEQVEKNSDNIFENQRALQDRIVNLEAQVAELREETAAEVQSQEELREESRQLAQRVTALEDGLESHSQDVDRIRSDLSAMGSDLDGEIEAIQEQLSDAQREIQQDVETSQENLAGLETRLDDVAARLALLQTAQDLLKVRLLLVEENPGIARDTLQLAIAHLDRAAVLLPTGTERLDDMRERMVGVDDLITRDSFRARPTLEALWADIMDLALPLTSQSVVTGTQPVSTRPTSTPSP